METQRHNRQQASALTFVMIAAAAALQPDALKAQAGAPAASPVAVQPARAQAGSHPWLAPPAAADADDAWTSAGAADRFVVGLRYVHVFLTDDSRPYSDSYVGHVTDLDAKQDGNPLHWLYAQWWLPSTTAAGLGLELGWTHMEAAALNDNVPYSDGDVSLSGPALCLLGRFPIDLRSGALDWTVIPRAGVGVAWLAADFDHTLWWHYGFNPDDGVDEAEAAYLDWVSRGAPVAELPSTRTIELDDSLGFIVTGAIEARTGPWGAELYLRLMNADAEGLYRQEWRNGTVTVKDADFALDHIGVGAGVSYAF